MTIKITSFHQSCKETGEKFSVAVFQPKGFSYKVLSFLAPLDCEGRRIHLEYRELEKFKEALQLGYKKRWQTISTWLKSLSADKDIVLCCWCPYTQGAKQAIKTDGFFACHIGLIAKMIKKYRPDIPVELSIKHQKWLYKDWHPCPEESTSDTEFEEIFF